jgi:RNA polymerase sigma-70 factor, ECF subfamily
MAVSEDFARLTGRFRSELLAHCYRMLGSADEAEDLVQETYLRAWRLAFAAALQYLSARQRAMLILRDVLEWPAAEVADLLGTTTTAVNSGLRRARAQLARALPAEDELAEPAGRQAVADFFAARTLTAPGRFRLVPVISNGQPGFAVYQREPDGVHHAYAVTVPTLTTAGIARIVTFLNLGLFAAFGLPQEHGPAAAPVTPGHLVARSGRIA